MILGLLALDVAAGFALHGSNVRTVVAIVALVIGLVAIALDLRGRGAP